MEGSSFERDLIELINGAAEEKPEEKLDVIQTLILPAKEAVSDVIRSVCKYYKGAHLDEYEPEGPLDPHTYMLSASFPVQRGYPVPFKIITTFYPFGIRKQWEDTLSVVFVMAIGVNTTTCSLPALVRKWRDAGGGGEVIFEGKFDRQAIISRMQDWVVRALRFYQMMNKHDDLTDPHRVADIRLWPITKLVIPNCNRCAMPAIKNRCPFCGAFIRNRQENLELPKQTEKSGYHSQIILRRLQK